jgi:sodium/hydrogen antiporter
LPHELPVALLTVGGLVLATGLWSGRLQGLGLSAPLLALGLGVLLGPAGADALDPARWGPPPLRLLEEMARLTLAIALMGVALRLPRGFVRRQWRALALLFAVGMPLMAGATALLGWAVLGLGPLVALLLGAVLCPTDPVVATSIVTGPLAERHLPGRLRDLVSAESGGNDGLAYPLVFLPVLLLTHAADAAWADWMLRIVLWQVGFAVALGLAIGYGAGRLLHRAERERTLESHSFLAFTLALTLLVLGAARLLHVDGIVAVFVAGLALDQVASASERRREERVQEAVNQFFTLPIFTLFGLMLPWSAWAALGWRGALLVAAVLLLRRLPAWLLLGRFVPALRRMRDAAFAGWFGPMGVAALFYAVLALRHTGETLVWPAASLLVAASVVVHGVSAAPLTRLYGRA